MDEMTRQTFIKEHYDFEDLLRVVKQLRAPDGCPWDRAQTHESMHDCMIEESFEVIEAVNNNDIPNMKEELGDVLLQVIMHSTIAEESGEFTFENVVDELARKLVRRHPHVFGENEKAGTPAEGLSHWEDIKKKEKEEAAASGIVRGELSGIPHELPPIMRAKKVIKKAEKIYGNVTGSDVLMQEVARYMEAEKALNEAIDTFIEDKEG